ncbi:RNA-binding protein 12-like [Paramacrobiotus metropolitanus]|uniref:RNA-binding protein 12-like n=1 Tax=Paramacrobiotus metropolitanus TaxID=2943436 RepID=UPI002445AFA8|nr:RNA-binding protein 12-like [Paramacrobiotus metropolitanus]
MAGPGNASPNKTQLAPPPDALPGPPLPLPFPHGPPHHPSGHPFLARMGPMLPPGAHPGGWSPLFAASAAGSLLQSGALNAQHAAAANFFTQNPNSAFSAPGRMPPGLMGANGMVHPRLPVNAGQRENVVSRSKEDGVETNGALAPPTKTHRTSPSENVRVAQKSPDGSSVKKPEKLISVTVSRNLSNSDSTKLTERLENSPPNSSEPSAKRRKSDSSDSRPLSPSV